MRRCGAVSRRDISSSTIILALGDRPLRPSRTIRTGRPCPSFSGNKFSMKAAPQIPFWKGTMGLASFLFWPDLPAPGGRGSCASHWPRSRRTPRSLGRKQGPRRKPLQGIARGWCRRRVRTGKSIFGLHPWNNSPSPPAPLPSTGEGRPPPSPPAPLPSTGEGRPPPSPPAPLPSTGEGSETPSPPATVPEPQAPCTQYSVLSTHARRGFLACPGFSLDLYFPWPRSRKLPIFMSPAGLK